MSNADSNGEKKTTSVLEIRVHSKDSSLQALEKIIGLYELDDKQKSRDVGNMTDTGLARDCRCLIISGYLDHGPLYLTESIHCIR